jgi:DNA-binding transcriptional ArsR family regulator
MDEEPGNGGRTDLRGSRPREERLMDALGDPVVRQILSGTHASPRTAQELYQITGVPLTTLYRKLHELQEIDLVGIERAAITPDGKRVDFYRSRIEEVHVELREGRFGLRARYRNLSATRMEGLWGAVRKEAER